MGGNRRKLTTFGTALTDSFHISVTHESVARIEPTISEVKGACSDDCATDIHKPCIFTQLYPYQSKAFLLLPLPTLVQIFQDFTLIYYAFH